MDNPRSEKNLNTTFSIEALYRIFQKYSSVCTDTRKVQPGDLFFALKGDHFNGNLFAIQALHNGAAYAIIDEANPVQDDRLILVKDVLKSLQELAAYHRSRFSIPFIAITGSNGKTTTTTVIASPMRKDCRGAGRP